MNLIGQTFIRNGIKYDYPFVECISSLKGICKTVYVAVGASDDETETCLKKMDGLKLISTVWDENLRKDGLILSQQTNLLLDQVRSEIGEGWILSLQADEVIHEREYEQLLKDLHSAEESGCDVVRFRYLHFWQSYERIAYGRRWYPQEIRAVRIASAVKSFGDAQSFQGFQKCFESNVQIYHYGHVREQVAYVLKKKDFHRWWHSDQEIAQKVVQGEKKDMQELTLAYLGSHPKVMAERIARRDAEAGRNHSLKRARELLVYDPHEQYQRVFGSRLPEGLQVKWTSSLREALRGDLKDTVFLEELGFLDRLWSCFRVYSRVPRSMCSPEARAWTPEFWAVLRFSEKGVRVGCP